MVNDSHAILEDLLARYHQWAKGFVPVPICGADPMFRNAKAGRSWDSTDEIVEDEINGGIMKALDFQIGEMPDQQPKAYRSAIYCLARNCYTGRNVWLSPRLPKDPFERAEVVSDARGMLIRRLMAAGVM